MRLEPGAAFHAEGDARARLALCYFGVLRLSVGADAWFVPSKCGVLIPARLSFALRAQTRVEVHEIVVDAGRVAGHDLPGVPTVVRGTPLLRGIAQRLAAEDGRPLTRAEAGRLALVTFDELRRLDPLDLRLPGGRDPRLAAAIAHLVGRPGDPHGIAALAHRVGTSERTLGRLFANETGLTFRDWRRRLRFVMALEGLERGEGSTALASRLGYSSVSAFVAAFRAQFGEPPSAYRRGR